MGEEVKEEKGKRDARLLLKREREKGLPTYFPRKGGL